MRRGINTENCTVQKTSPFPNPIPGAPEGSIHAKITTSANELKRKYLSTDTAVESNQRIDAPVTSVMQRGYHSCIRFATGAYALPLVHSPIPIRGERSYS